MIELTDEPEAKDIHVLGSDVIQKVYDNLPLREQAHAARASKQFKGTYDVARNHLLGDADGKLIHIVHYYQKRIARPSISQF